MAKKDELLNEKNNETNEVSEDNSLEVKGVEELQEDFSSMFDDDIEETDTDEIPENFPTPPLFGRYSKYYGPIDEKLPKKRKFPWSKKSEEDIIDEAEKELAEIPEEETDEQKVAEEISEIEETDEQDVVVEKQPKKSIFSWKKKERAIPEEIVEEVVEEKVEEKTEEVIEETPIPEEKTEETVDEVVEELPPFEEDVAEEVIEELPPFEEDVVEEVVEELPPFEEEVAEEVVEELPPFEEDVAEEVIEELPSFEEEIVEEAIEEIPPFEQTETKDVESMSSMNPSEDAEEKKPESLLTKKDHLTFVLVIIALILSITFICVKFLPMDNSSSFLGNIVENVFNSISL